MPNRSAPGPENVPVAAPAPRMLHLLAKGATEYGLMLVTPQERIVYWNEGCERIFGYSEKEILGQHFSVLFTEEDNALGVCRKELEKARTQGWAEDERWHARKDGSRFWANGAVTCLREDEQLLGYSKILRDQTLRKQTEDKLKSALHELTHFSHVVSHDLQEPLRTVQAYIALARKRLREGKDIEKIDEALSSADSGAKRMHRLLNDLLSFARVENSSAIRERTDTAAICDTVVANLKLQIEDSKATVTRTSMPIIQAMPTQLAQLFQNLISNALKYRRQDVTPLILIEARSDGKEWIFSVKDNGIGIAPDQVGEAFGAFKRLHEGQQYPGSGLGLFICKKIVERHGGRIWIESEPGQGTKVSFTLCCNPQDEPSCSQAAAQKL